MNSSTLHFSSAFGTSPSTCTSAISRVSPISRPRMMSLRATSIPDRSSRGSGSVYPLVLAAPTMEEKLSRPSKTLNRYASVPEKIPSMRVISSPVSRKSRSVWMMGNPAPTVASYK